MSDYYEELGISPDMLLGKTPAEITAIVNKAFRTESLIHHPDKNPGNELAATEKTKAINEARNVLLDENRRAAYDKMKEEQVASEIFDENERPEKTKGLFGGDVITCQALCPLKDIQKEFDEFVQKKMAEHAKDKLADPNNPDAKMNPEELGYSSKMMENPTSGLDMLRMDFPNKEIRQEFIDHLLSKEMIKDPELLKDEQKTADSRPSPFGNPGATPRLTKD